MIIAIPDDYHGLVHQLDCFRRLAGHDVRIFRDAAPDAARLVANLRDADAIVPIRERTRYTRAVIEQLPRLKLFSQTGRSTHHIDVTACAERGIAITTGTHASPYTVSEHTWTLILAALRRIPAHIVHGRYDMCTPLASAWALKKAWPEVQLDIIPDAGHSSLESGIVDALVRATDAMVNKVLW